MGCSTTTATSGNKTQDQSLNTSKYLPERPVIENSETHSGNFDDKTPFEYCKFMESKKVTEDITVYISGDLTYFPKDHRVYNNIVVELSDKSSGEEKILAPSTSLNNTGFRCDVIFQDQNPAEPDGVFELTVIPWYEEIPGQEFHFQMWQQITIDPENHTMDIELIRIDPISHDQTDQDSE